MTSRECAHIIEVDNLENGEIITHTLLLIKGYIRQQKISTSSPSSTAAHATSKCTGQQQIVLRVQLRSADNEDEEAPSISCLVQQQTQISRNGQFKLLCDLGQIVAVAESRQLTLQLVLRFCSTVQHLELLYKAEIINKYQLQPLYIVCCNQNPSTEELTENCAKIDLNLRLVQSVYAEQLRAANFGRLTFTLHKRCQVFVTNQTCQQVWQQNEDSLWQTFASELLNSSTWGDKTNLKFVAFIGCTKYDGEAVANSGDYSYANIRRHLKGHAALGGGGLALFGTAYLYAWPQCVNDIQPQFSNNKPVDLKLLPEDSNYRRTHGGVYATTLGAVVHEIGHTFDLGHTKDGVMGNGFDYINRVFTIDNLTECLPDRVIDYHQAPQPAAPRPPRFTQIKRTTNTFLDKYHEQKTNELFYFTRNCLIILAKHKWFGNCSDSGGVEPTDDAQITYDAFNGCVVSPTGGSQPLCLIEVRCVDNSLVKFWYELQSDKDKSAIYKFHLPKEAIEALHENHYLFVLTQSGLITRLCER